MLISKFQILIRNKIVWGVFAVLVSVSMLGFFAPKSRSGRQDASASEMLIYGEPVSESEYKTARFFLLDLGSRPGPDSDAGRDELKQAVLRRLALLKHAQQMGLRVSDAEVARAIQADRTFANEQTGQFDKNRYMATLQRGMRISPAIFEAYMREEMLLRQLMSTAAATLWVPPADVDRELARYTDVLAFEVATMELDALVPELDIDDAAAQRYYEANQEEFRVSEKRSVKLVQWTIADFVETNRVSDMSVQDFYDMHIEDYAIVETNGATSTYTPLVEVRSNIVAKLALTTATYKARRTAASFAELLAPNEYNEPGLSFDAAAASNELAVTITPLFTQRDTVADIDADYSFNQTAFELDPKSLEDYFSAPIAGSEHVYVIAYADSKPSAIPPFKEVKEQALAYATDEARATAIAEAGAALKTRLTAAIMAGKNFADVAGSEKLTVTRHEGISAYTSTGDEFEQFPAVIGSLLDLQTGQLSDLIENEATAIFVYILTRAPGDFATIEMTRPAVKGELQRMRMRQHFAEWTEAITKEAITETGAGQDEAAPEAELPVETPSA